MTTRTTAAQAPHADFFPPPPRPRSPARRLRMVADDYRELVGFWPVIHNMVAQDLRLRYQRSVLGFVWTLLNPILMMITFTVVFSQLMHTDWRSYSLYLFAGMVPWGLMAAGLNDCAFCIIINESLIRKIYLPKLVFPITKVLVNLAIFVLSMGALFLMMIPLGARFTAPMLLLPAIVLIYAAFVLGLGLILAVANTFFRDCSHLVNVFLQAWYFATPILYPASQFKSTPWLLTLNPVYPIIRLFQVVISGNQIGTGHGEWPDPMLFLSAAAIATVSLGVGYAAFKAHQDKLVFRL